MGLWPAVKKINSDLSNPLDKLIGRVEKYNPSFAGAVLSNCEIDTDGSIIISSGQTTATVSEDIAVSSFSEWYKYYIKKTTPTTSTITCAIKDTSDNVLIASITDGGSLSSIDAQTYKTIRLIHTLTRDTTGDDTPILHYREVSWIGELIANEKNCVFHTATSNSAYVTALSQSGKGTLNAVTQIVGYGATEGSNLKVIVDDVILLDTTDIATLRFLSSGSAQKVGNLILNKAYNKSFIIQHKTINTSTNVITAISYEEG